MNQKVQPDWHLDAVIYQLHVKAYRDSNRDGFGDFKGLIEKLDYIASLGVTALWLMPVFESPSYHGYDTTDYLKIEPDYGTNADFARLITEAHNRGIKVIVDMVLNHHSDKHPWFIEAQDPARLVDCDRRPNLPHRLPHRLSCPRAVFIGTQTHFAATSTTTGTVQEVADMQAFPGSRNRDSNPRPAAYKAAALAS